MEAVLIILGLAGLYFILENSHSRMFGSGSTAASGSAAGYTPPSESYSGPTSNQGMQQLEGLGSTALAAIPVVGGALAAISGGMFAASAQRRKQAINENMAVAKFIPGMDSDIRTIVAAYNSGQINGPQAAQLFEQIWNQYWSEVTPQIQPQRNGCNSGANIPRSQGGPPGAGGCGYGQGPNYIANKYQCSGSWGAACCVGGYVIEGTVSNLKWGAMQADAVGQATVNVCAVMPSNNPQYGNYSRAGYSVTFIKP